jgi:hypothetical protein
MTHRSLVPAALLLLGFMNGAGLLSADEAPQVTATIIGQKYCLGPLIGISREVVPADAITLMFQVRLNYGNTGSEPIIVPTVANPTIVITRSLSDVDRRRNQTIVPPKFKGQFGNLEEQGIDLSVPTNRLFAVIQPGSDATPLATQDLVLRIHDPSISRLETEFLGKHIFVQLELDHLMIPERLAKDLKFRWRSFGDLWIGKVRTKPFEFDIPSSPGTSVCASPLRMD